MPQVDPTAAKLGALAVLLAVLTGCAATDPTEVLAQSSEGAPAAVEQTEVAVIPELVYGPDAAQRLDACLPLGEAELPRAAVILIHGGSWARGDKADAGYGPICRWLAAAGYPTFSVNYRLAPAAVFPAAIDDVAAAVAWLREPAQRERFLLDPARIAAFGGSAGGNLAALLGTRGAGELDVESRVAAVVDLSGPADLTGADTTVEFAPVQLAYLGCAVGMPCPAAVDASPIFQVDPSDPPFFVAHSTHELIPLAQSAALVDALRAAGVSTEFVRVEGDRHSIAMLDDQLRRRILDFLGTALTPTGSAPA